MRARSTELGARSAELGARSKAPRGWAPEPPPFTLSLSKSAPILLLLLTGCAHQHSGRATVLEPGQGQLSIAGEISMLDPGAPRGPPLGIPWVQGAIGYHHGLGARMELGVRAFGFGIPNVGGEAGGALDWKLQLIRNEDRMHGVDLATGASVSYHFVMQGDQPFHVVGGVVPLLLGLNMGPHQLVFGLKVGDYVLSSYGQKPQNNVFFGGSIGLALRVRRVQFQPELSLLYAPVRWGGETPADETTGLTVVSFGIALPIDVTDVGVP